MSSTNQNYVNDWVNFPYKDNFIFINDISKNNDFNLGFTYTESDIRKNLNFNGEVSKMNFWNSQNNRNIIWFYAHFRMLNYYIANPNYDYYWFFDDDVRASNWEAFFDGFKSNDADFISYFCFKNRNISTQENIHEIDNRTYSSHNWFSRFPGPGDVIPNDVKNYFGSFFPAVRYSNAALNKLKEINENGFSGYSEGFVPTMLNHYGMKLDTIIKPDNTSKHFDVDVVNMLHKNIRVTWEWI
jgi:hypothetical protein